MAFQRFAFVLLLSLMCSACTTVGDRDPLEVTVAGIEALPGEGLELRLLVKLRVQNPNDTPLAYDGTYVKLDVQGRNFATGVSDAVGTVPRFGESVIGVTVTVSALRMVRTMLGMLDGQPVDTIRYDLTGKLDGAGFRAARFNAGGELRLTPDRRIQP